MDIKRAKQRPAGVTFKTLKQGDLFAVRGSTHVYLVVHPQINIRRVVVVNLSTDELVKTSSFKDHDLVRRVQQVNTLIIQEDPVLAEFDRLMERTPPMPEYDLEGEEL